jgi:hypothetical protein
MHHLMQDTNRIEVYLEIGQVKTFAVALDWPGWCRSGRDGASALQALIDYGPRYAHALRATQLQFRVPSDASAFVVVEQLMGNGTTDFGAPSLALSHDMMPIEAADLQRWQEILRSCWLAFDTAVREASGKVLSKGPRGGGRELIKIVQHVRDVDLAYLSSLGGKVKTGDESALDYELDHIRNAILTTLTAAAHGEVPARGPRGGVRWPARYFVRRLAWHELDHAWEIEDRVM